MHRFYQEQFQLNGGAQNRYVAGSDALGLAMGVYRTKRLPIYRYLHRRRAPRYVIADRFFQGAFGGSFLNHQWLVAARTPTWPGAPADQHSIVDSKGLPTTDKPLTAVCPSTTAACGDFAVNTIQPTYQPHGGGAQLPPQKQHIGERLTAKRVTGPGTRAAGRTRTATSARPGGPRPGAGVQRPGRRLRRDVPELPRQALPVPPPAAELLRRLRARHQARARHLRDEQELIAAARASKRTCKLRRVTRQADRRRGEHPGYASVAHGSRPPRPAAEGASQPRLPGAD